MAKRSVLKDYAELRAAAMEVWKLGRTPPENREAERKWAALAAALKLPPGSTPGS